MDVWLAATLPRRDAPDAPPNVMWWRVGAAADLDEAKRMALEYYWDRKLYGPQYLNVALYVLKRAGPNAAWRRERLFS